MLCLRGQFFSSRFSKLVKLETTETMSRRSTTRPSSDYSKFRQIFDNSKRIVALTGAGVSAESGVPTFRGAGGLWRKYRAQELATPRAFISDPALVWQFYAYRRQMVATKVPNQAHKALAFIEKKFHDNSNNNNNNNQKLSIVTQNIDELHQGAGSRSVLELHGTLYKTRCTGCQKVEENRTIPIVPALGNVSMDETEAKMKPKIEIDQLPHCSSCKSLLRPHIVWFNESLDPKVLDQAEQLLSECDLLLVIGTSSVVYPAAMFAPQVAARGVTVAEFNLEPTSASDPNGFYFEGPCGKTLPKAFGIETEL